ncbi:hypothetical protein CBS147355_5411 [Penicillium roqueforti]|nr:hypothetical protein CBS147355_5411 [Penicillium roqueforti]KAI3272389.1 hypothetical protein CBS147309_4936 [Penicillium roqueforti]
MTFRWFIVIGRSPADSSQGGYLCYLSSLLAIVRCVRVNRVEDEELNSQVCGTCRPLHTLTALPRDAIDLAGYVTEDDMRPLPTERPRDTTRSSIDWLCGSTPANFLDFFQRNRSGDLHLTISGGQSSMPVSLRFSDRPDFNVDFDDSVKPSMPYDTLFVHTIIHQTRASEHATAAITRDTRDGDAEASTMGRQQFRREIGRFDQRV